MALEFTRSRLSPPPRTTATALDYVHAIVLVGSFGGRFLFLDEAKNSTQRWERGKRGLPHCTSMVGHDTVLRVAVSPMSRLLQNIDSVRM
jgi:hypothetical protein